MISKKNYIKKMLICGLFFSLTLFAILVPKVISSYAAERDIPITTLSAETSEKR